MTARRCSTRASRSLSAAALGALLLLPGCVAGEERASRPPERAGGEVASDGDCRGLGRLVRRVRRGYVPVLSPDLSVIPREPNYVGSAASPVHSGPWDYLAEVPFVVFGPGVVEPAGALDLEATLADVAPSTARLVGFRGYEDGGGAPNTDGRVLPALDPVAGKPRLVVTIVWDGGGDNVLEQHEGSWPFLARLMRTGTSFEEMTIGSSPSVTPPVHATLSTGVFPRRHGVPGLRIRVGGEYVDPLLGLDPARLEVPTLGDLYDRALDNRPVVGMTAAVNWHLGMVGHGASHPGGDRDPAVLLNEAGELLSNESLYSLPDIGDVSQLEGAVTRLDGRDGDRDGLWRGHELGDPAVRYSSPAHVDYQELILERLVTAGGFGADRTPDLLYVNFKPGDDAGHRWGMTSPEVGEVIAAQDAALRRFVSFLDRRVGRGRWVVMLTADHGQTPYPEESGAWPIGGAEVARDVNAVFDRNDNAVPLADRVTSPGVYLNESEVEANATSPEEIAEWLAGYSVAENLKEGEELPPAFAGRGAEPLFDAVVPGRGRAALSCRL